MKGFIVVHCSNDIVGDYEVIVNLSTVRTIDICNPYDDYKDQHCALYFDKEVIYQINKYKIKSSVLFIKENFCEVLQLIETATN